MNKTQHLACLSMTFGLELGVDQLSVHADLEAATVRRNKGYTFDYVLIILKQFACQAHGPVSVVSNSAINNLYFEHNYLPV